eukprot:tig00021612_g22871.t1
MSGKDAEVKVTNLDEKHAKPTDGSAPPPKNLGSLLRLFKSQFFDAFIAITYLHKYDHQGVQDYLCNELYKYPDEVIEQYLPQLCHLLLHRESPALERFILDRCAKSMHLAFQTFWFFHACADDFQKGVTGENRSTLLRGRCETGAVNGYWSTQPSANPKKEEGDGNTFGKNKFKSVPAELNSILLEDTRDRDDADEKDPTNQPAQTGADGQASASGEAAPAPEYTGEELLADNRTIGVPNTPNPSGRSASTSPPPLPTVTASSSSSHTRVTFANGDGPADAPLPALTVSNTDTGTSEAAAIPTSPTKEEDEDYQVKWLMSKQKRFEYFTAEINFFRQLANIGFRLTKVFPVENRNPTLRAELDHLNSQLPSGVYLPVCKATDKYARICRIPVEEAVCLNSREKVPYLVYLEVLDTELTPASTNIYETAMTLSAAEEEARDRARRARSLYLAPPPPPPKEKPRSKSPFRRREGPKEEEGEAPGRSRTPQRGAAASPPPLAPGGMSPTSPGPSEEKKAPGERPEDLMILKAIERANKATPKQLQEQQREKTMAGFRFEHQDKVFSETWGDKMGRIRKQSPYGHLPGWRITSVIVKSGDDCRQEQLASQLIEVFYNIFREAKLPLWLRPYSVLVISSHAALVETVPNAPSVATLKKQTPNFTTLKDYFKDKFGGGDVNSDGFRLAQRNFVESMAGYSLLTYLLQIKDRHNGNILLDAEGHIVHIDYGFMLSNSPGGVNFETAPFKLTAEFVEVMGGEGTDAFNYFKFLCVRGFLELRKHHEKLVLLVEMMRRGSKLPCFLGGKAAVDAFRDRFNITLTEQAGVEFMMRLIDESANNWRTRQYDNFQRITNGIL